MTVSLWRLAKEGTKEEGSQSASQRYVHGIMSRGRLLHLSMDYRCRGGTIASDADALAAADTSP